jgi:hypothetical protein
LHAAGHLRLGCDQTDSLLASPFGLVIERSVAIKLAKKLCDPPLFSAGDELLKGSGDSGFFGWLSAHVKGSIEQVLVESLSSRAPAGILVAWVALCDAYDKAHRPKTTLNAQPPSLHRSGEAIC